MATPNPATIPHACGQTSDRVDSHLRSTWNAMLDDASPLAQARALGAVTALRALGLLSADAAELWLTRFPRCPGHEGEGGRVWCAYCGGICRICGEPNVGQRCPAGYHCAECCDFSLDECTPREGGEPEPPRAYCFGCRTLAIGVRRRVVIWPNGVSGAGELCEDCARAMAEGGASVEPPPGDAREGAEGDSDG